MGTDRRGAGGGVDREASVSPSVPSVKPSVSNPLTPFKVDTFAKYFENDSASKVADISTTLNSGRFRNSALNNTNRKSVFMSRSCTSSIMTCEMPSSVGSRIKRRNSTPVVTNSTDAPSSRGDVP